LQAGKDITLLSMDMDNPSQSRNARTKVAQNVGSERYGNAAVPIIVLAQGFLADRHGRSDYGI
jgi:hypothetical protein